MSTRGCSVWVCLTFGKLDPAHLDKARAFYNSKEVSDAIQQHKGYRFHCLLESVANQGDIISITAWDGQADAAAYQQSLLYSMLAKEFAQWFIPFPECEAYQVYE
jgi:heme-degrading monooxygenase HmoA